MDIRTTEPDTLKRVRTHFRVEMEKLDKISDYRSKLKAIRKPPLSARYIASQNVRVHLFTVLIRN